MTSEDEIEWYPLPEVEGGEGDWGREVTAAIVSGTPSSTNTPPSVGTRESGSGHNPGTKEGITRHSSSDSRLLKPGKIASGPTHHSTDGLGPGLHSEPPTLTAHTHSSPSLMAASTGVKLIPPSLPSPPVTSSLPHRLTQGTPPGDLTITSLLSSAGRSDALPNCSTTGYVPGVSGSSSVSTYSHSSSSLPSSHSSLPGYHSYLPSYLSAQSHMLHPPTPHISLHSHLPLKSHSTPFLPPSTTPPAILHPTTPPSLPPPTALPSLPLSNLDQLWCKFLSSALAMHTDHSVHDGRQPKERKGKSYLPHLPPSHTHTLFTSQPHSSGNPTCTCHKAAAMSCDPEIHPPHRLTMDDEHQTGLVGYLRATPSGLPLSRDTRTSHWHQKEASVHPPRPLSTPHLADMPPTGVPPPPSAVGCHAVYSTRTQRGHGGGGGRGRELAVQTSPTLTTMQVRVPLRVVPPSPPPTLTHLSLQEALRVFRPQFILESERRQRRVLEVRRGRGRVGTRLSPIGAKEEASSSQERGRERVQTFVSVGPGRQRPKMTKREIYEQSKRYWGQLTEVREQMVDQRRREVAATNRLRVKLYQKEVLPRRARISRRK